jgi:hypothetical protein
MMLKPDARSGFSAARRPIFTVVPEHPSFPDNAILVSDNDTRIQVHTSPFSVDFQHRHVRGHLLADKYRSLEREGLG